MKRMSYLTSLLGATSLGFGVLAGTAGFAQDQTDCDTLFDTAALDCAQANAGTTVDIPVGPQTEREGAPNVNSAGFSISIDGQTVNSDPTVEDRMRRTDLALEQADVQVVFDGFEPEPRLAVETIGSPRAYAAGDTVTLQSESNYPAFIARGEYRIIDRGAVGGPKLLGTVPVTVNGQASVTVPQGNDIVVVHRVYDASGRFDETSALSLGVADTRGLRSDVEELAATTAVQNIRVRGGAVTVSATDMAPGARLVALGSSAPRDRSGGAVIQRILPPGDYDVDVAIDTSGRDLQLRRAIQVPGAEWFYVAVADLTFELQRKNGETDSQVVGRLQYYIDGETADGVQITSSLDTGEGEINDVIRRLDEKDPRSVLERIDPADTFPTFGDDSEIRDATPTSGKFYLRIEDDGNYALWGDFRATVNGSNYVRNERSLYGAQGVYESQARAANGDARFAAEVYASQPDQLVGRETFRGTGGSVYFLRQQDVTPGTETLSVEIRDAVTGRVVDQQTLVAGRDYSVNYLQGVITLVRPLAGSTNNNLIQTNPGGDQIVNLVAQYEFTPTTSDVDGFSFGGRVEGWVTDEVRLGFTATSDDTGSADQRSMAVDLRYQLSENSFMQLDVAKSEGPGFDSSSSLDGGLTINTATASAGDGLAYRLAGQADLRDLGASRDGIVGGYFEKREEGFSTLDYSVTGATGDETLTGAFARVEKTDTALGWAIYADLYENTVGTERGEFGAEVSGNINTQLSFEVGAEFLDATTTTTDGSRLDVAARLNFEASESLTYSAFVQGTANSDGLDEYNRYGLAIERAVTENWMLGGELSGGTGGVGGSVMAEYADGGNSAYFGYELDTGRAINAGVASGENGGKFVAGGRRQVNDRTAVFGENTYDLFGDRRTLTSAYGLEYVQSDYLTYDTALEMGRVTGSANEDIERTAVSFGARYNDAQLRANARVEYRRDEAALGSTANDLDALYFNADAEYKMDLDQRMLGSLSYANAESDTSSVLAGKVVDASIGYAYRPVDSERLNVLTRYRYLHDTFGQEVEGVANGRVRQESHVFSVEANYDLTREWTVGGKIGGRLSQTQASDADPWVKNDAILAMVNARYNLVHNWDILVEARSLNLEDAGLSEVGVLGAVYRHLGNNAKIGVGYNFSTFSDDLTDLSQDDEGLFLNVIAKF